MTKEELLNINEEKELKKELLKYGEYYKKIENWSNDLIEHYLKVVGINMQQFENGFNSNYIPYDEEKEMNE